MFRGPEVKPLAVAPRVMPDGTLPTDAGMPPMSLEQMTMGLHNPKEPTPGNLAHGKELFLTTCAPCHGETGAGDGPVAHLLKHAPVNLNVMVPDGFIFGYIRNGGVYMPSYGDAMSADERWDVVLWVKHLQQEAAKKRAKAAGK